MERRGADKYPGTFLQKTFKELEAAGKTLINFANGTGAAADGANGANGTKEDDDAVKEEDTGEGDEA